MPVFLVGFVVLLVLSGLGNGSTYTMIPGIFQTKALALGLRGEDAAAHVRRLSGAVTGLFGALGGLGVNLAFREAFRTVHTGAPAFLSFLLFCVLCFAVTWWVYLRKSAAGPVVAKRAEPRPNHAGVRAQADRRTSGGVTGRKYWRTEAVTERWQARAPRAGPRSPGGARPRRP
ncbi:nitrate/nitrite transporter NarK [Streptomyces zagrosensis]|uniref:Nitrate/nitrite transporter NarK n=1 Tax=Streptomyces zagrosensis TaxID=1042984 RepID=A0A7W9Q852_9ACTN|nr:nitrate/nitrite transporter NarK [Streptomyces zagrosensis]